MPTALHNLSIVDIEKIVAFYQKDFLPEGTLHTIIEVMEKGQGFEPIKHEAWRCCQITNHNDQNARMYCGKVAHYITELPSGLFVALCAHHSRGQYTRQVTSCTEKEGQMLL